MAFHRPDDPADADDGPTPPEARGTLPGQLFTTIGPAATLICWRAAGRIARWRTASDRRAACSRRSAWESCLETANAAGPPAGCKAINTSRAWTASQLFTH